MVETAADQERHFQDQLQAAQELVGLGGQALRQGQTEAGEEALKEAEAILDMAEIDGEELWKLRARVFNELGVVFQRRNDMEQSRRYHRQAADLCETIVDTDPLFGANAAATQLNLSSVELASGHVEEAEATCARALEFLALVPEEEQGTGSFIPLLLGAHQNMAVIHGRAARWEEAGGAMDKALDAAERLPVENQAGYVMQVAQGCQQLSVLLFTAEQFDAALHWGRKAESLSEQGYEALGQPALGVYIISQVNLISYYEKLGQFADAEDCLWKAVEVAGKDPRILLRGVSFYETCRKQADPRLEEGNLPRDEVDSGLEELMTMVEAAGGVGKLKEQVERLQRSAGATR